MTGSGDIGPKSWHLVGGGKKDWRDLSTCWKLAAPGRHVARRAAMYPCNWRPCKVMAMAYPRVFDFPLLFSTVFHLRGNDPSNLRGMIHQIVLVGNLHLPKVKILSALDSFQAKPARRRCFCVPKRSLEAQVKRQMHSLKRRQWQ